MAFGLNLLVADDEPSILEFYKILLESEQHNVVCTKDGEECLAAYLDAVDKNKVIDLVILDYRMPGKNGLEVARGIRMLVPSQNLLMVTAYSGVINMEDKPENMTILAKPFEPQQLLDAIATICAIKPATGILESLVENGQMWTS
jgi:CheY-like chemotaxis protein